tara:strand:+ start:314 stop:658 length:345 start_codon:yes stop_codon:yes gene_type:complete
MKPLEVLKKAAEIVNKKGNDYQNPNSRVRQADYYPRGCSTILDIMFGKILRMQSLLEAYEADPVHEANYESLEDSAIDLINYSAFFAAYLTGDIDGQDPNRDFLNRGVKKDGSV